MSKPSKIVIAVTTVLMIAYDILALCMGWTTLSRQIFTWSKSFPFLTYAIAVLLGHWSFPYLSRAGKLRIISMAVISTILLTLNIIFYGSTPLWMMPVSVFVGYWIGAVLWTQGNK